MRPLLILCTVALMAAALQAAPPHPDAETKGSAAQIVYSREKVFIEVEAPVTTAAPVKETPKPTVAYARNADGSIAGESDKEEKTASPAPGEATKTETRRYYFDTDVKPQESLEVTWFYSLESIREGRATMIVMKEARPLSLPEARLYKPVDVLVIGDDGAILAILPKIILATQEKSIKLDMPVKALMYVSGGAAEALHIAPKDMVKYRAFLTNPVVLQ